MGVTQAQPGAGAGVSIQAKKCYLLKELEDDAG